MKLKLIYITLPDRDTATHIAKILVQEKLCACVNILGEIESYYMWHDELCDSKEVLMLVKTAYEKLVIDKVTKLHPYKIPCILSFDIAGGNKAYLEWLKW